MHRFAPVLVASLMSSTAFAPVVLAQDGTAQTGDECQNLSQLIEENQDTLSQEWITEANAVVQAGDPAECATYRDQAMAELGAEQAGAQTDAEDMAAEDAATTEGAAEAEGTDADAATQQQQVSADPGQPQVIVRQAPPTVRVQMPQPTITIDMPPPEITIVMPDLGQPAVTVESAEPDIQIESEGEPQVEFNQSGEPTVTVEEGQAGAAQPADTQPEGAATEDMPADEAATEDMPAEGTEDAQAEDTAAEDAQQTDAEGAMALIVTTEPVEVGEPTPYPVSEVIGQQLVNVNDENLGTVERVVVVENRNYVVLGADSPLSDDGQAGVVLPLEHISFVEGRLVMRGMTEAELTELQDFEGSGAQDVPEDQQVEIGTR